MSGEGRGELGGSPRSQGGGTRGKHGFPRDCEPQVSGAHSVDPLEEDVDLAPARESDAPRELVLDPEIRLQGR